MNETLVEEIVQAVLYEGYILYPYRASSKKNSRERFTFGRVYPQSYSQAQNGAEPFVMQTECLARASSPEARLSVSVRFLHPMAREVMVPVDPENKNLETRYRTVPELRVREQLFQTWHEAVERRVEARPFKLTASNERQSRPFRFPATNSREPIHDGQKHVGVVRRRQAALDGKLEISTRRLKENLFKLTVRLANQTPMPRLDENQNEALLLRTFASAHTVLQIEGGEFVSLMEPPLEIKEAAAQCSNVGTWPVLVGEEEGPTASTMLSSPIILYDFPKTAPESAGTLFDGTEIDEILTLRILTMTDAEKREMRDLDQHARRLLERSEGLSEDSLLKMHGTLRQVKAPDFPANSEPPFEFDDFFGSRAPLETASIGEVPVRAGDRVRLRPKARADVMDIAMEGQVAVIEAIEEDVEHRVQLAVVLENDPGKDLGMLRQPGHRFFYGLDEVEVLAQEVQ